jgi:oligopeptidase B
MMQPTAALQEKLYNEMLSHIKQTDVNVPFLRDGYYYYSRTEEGKQYPIYCRKKGSLDAPEEIILDQNELAQGFKFMSVGDLEASDDGNLLAYTTDNTGYRQYTMQIKDLRTKQLLPEKIERVDAIAWSLGATSSMVHWRGHSAPQSAGGVAPTEHSTPGERETNKSQSV